MAPFPTPHLRYSGSLRHFVCTPLGSAPARPHWPRHPPPKPPQKGRPALAAAVHQGLAAVKARGDKA